MQPAHRSSTASAADSPVTLDDVRRHAGDRWDIARITGGYRGVQPATGGYTPIPRYGRTAAELAESIRVVEGHR
jgi:hypothetical protein